MKVFITKYALSQGILEREVNKTQFSAMVSETNKRMNIYHKPFWHETMEEAIQHAETMRKAKIASLTKQISKLEKLNFNKTI